MEDIRPLEFPKLKKLRIATPLLRASLLDFEPRIDSYYVHTLADMLPSPHLESIILNAGHPFISSFVAVTLDEQWEDYHRRDWHISYLRNSNAINIHETSHSRLIVELKKFAKRSGLVFESINSWEIFLQWKQTLVRPF